MVSVECFSRGEDEAWVGDKEAGGVVTAVSLVACGDVISFEEGSVTAVKEESSPKRVGRGDAEKSEAWSWGHWSSEWLVNGPYEKVALLDGDWWAGTVGLSVSPGKLSDLDSGGLSEIVLGVYGQ